MNFKWGITHKKYTPILCNTKERSKWPCSNVPISVARHDSTAIHRRVCPSVTSPDREQSRHRQTAHQWWERPRVRVHWWVFFKLSVISSDLSTVYLLTDFSIPCHCIIIPSSDLHSCFMGHSCRAGGEQNFNSCYHKLYLCGWHNSCYHKLYLCGWHT